MAYQKNKPIAEFRLAAVKAAVWQNETKNGSRHNVTLTRLYRKDDDWHETTSFGRDDLPLVEKVAAKAHSFIFDQQAQKQEAESES